VRRVLLVAAAALALPAAARAHVVIAPPFVQDGIQSTIAFQTPNERPPHVTVGLSVTTPPGVAVDSAKAPKGWHAKISGSTVSWSGGRLTGRTTVDFPVTITAKVRAGTHPFAATQTYDDGATVKWNASLSVLPATGAQTPKQHPWGAFAAAVAGVLVIGGSVLLLRRARRAPVQQG
jgi:uncharacterized protein YcnI